jgi:putative tricarboxylic transport membrane protein
MKTAAMRERKGYLVMGGGGLLAAVVYLGLAVRMPFGEMDQPGAAVFPIVVGVILALASLATLREGWQMNRNAQIDLPAGVGLGRLAGLIGLLLGYVVVLPWLGQIVSSMVFCAVLMRVLSGLGWTRIVVYSAIIAIGLYALFVRLLQVPMPLGMWIY